MEGQRVRFHIEDIIDGDNNMWMWVEGHKIGVNSNHKGVDVLETQ